MQENDSVQSSLNVIGFLKFKTKTIMFVRKEINLSIY